MAQADDGKTMNELLNQLVELNKITKRVNMKFYYLIHQDGKLSICLYISPFDVEGEQRIGIIGDLEMCQQKMTERIEFYQKIVNNLPRMKSAIFPED